jgi:hypothetical protein
MSCQKIGRRFQPFCFGYKVLLNKKEGTKLKLIQDVSTRWNSKFFMLEHLLKLRIPVYGVIFDDKITKQVDRIKLDFKDNFWNIMECIVPVLEPLADITDGVGPEDVPTGSSVYILLCNIFSSVLQASADDTPVDRLN